MLLITNIPSVPKPFPEFTLFVYCLNYNFIVIGLSKTCHSLRYPGVIIWKRYTVLGAGNCTLNGFKFTYKAGFMTMN